MFEVLLAGKRWASGPVHTELAFAFEFAMSLIIWVQCRLIGLFTLSVSDTIRNWVAHPF